MRNEEINFAVAKRLGWKYNSSHDPFCYWDKPNGEHSMSLFPPDYCTSISAAWEIVEFLLKNGISCQIENSPWRNSPGDGESFHWCKINNEFQQADTAPMAICLVFLKIKVGLIS